MTVVADLQEAAEGDGELRQHWLLRDGALAYAIHAQLTTLESLATTLDALDLPDPTPFRRTLAGHRTAAEQLLRTSGVQAELAASL